MNNKKKINTTAIFLVFGAIAYLFCSYIINQISTTGEHCIPIIGAITKAISSIANIRGVIVTVQMLLCIIMTLINHRVGGRISALLLIYSSISLSFAIISSGDMDSIPGLSTMILSLCVVYVLAKQLNLRETDALTDYLTGLHNRRSILKNLERLIKAGKPFHVLFIDLDDFKFTNDSHGHKAGDQLLKVISERITAILDKNSVFGRIGGDEFVILLSERNNVTFITEEILRLINTAVYISDAKINCHISASIGITRFPEDSHNAEDLIKYADIAMYAAKAQGKNCIQFFDSALEASILREAELEATVKDGLLNNMFYLVYQPQYHTATHTLRGFETLLRMKNPDNKQIETSELIATAEKTDLIFLVDDYVLKKALLEFRDTMCGTGSQYTLSINVSARNISGKSFSDSIKKLLEETAFPASCLEIEITEYCLMNSFETAVDNIKSLKEMGIKIALDDFGTGYTSLSYVSKLPIDLIKIDKSFIDDIDSQSVNHDFINAVIHMGHLLNCEVISEGVETEAQLDMLRARNCDFIQGFLWGEPLSFEDASALCRKSYSEN